MKNNLIEIKKYMIIIYVLTMLIPYNLSKYINKKNKRIADIIYVSRLIKNKNFWNNNINININKDKDKDKDIKYPYFRPKPSNKTEEDDKDDNDDKDDDDRPNHDHDHDPIFNEEEEERRRQERNNLTTQIGEFESKINDLNTEIAKSKIYIAFLSVITVILFLMLVIYCSIKCYIICSKKNTLDYRVSDLSDNKLGEVYIDENGEDKMDNFMSKNNDECEAPIYSNNNSEKNVSTFNPDNYRAPIEDKNLYKPYNNEDI